MERHRVRGGLILTIKRETELKVDVTKEMNFDVTGNEVLAVGDLRIIGESLVELGDDRRHRVNQPFKCSNVPGRANR
jgi:hypothetical protein